MWGTSGAVSVAGAPLKHPECMAQGAAPLQPRGPDGERIVGHERARLGARRLAIMDLTTGDQPFQSADGAVWMVCNGEIYNARELRTQATGWGYPFRSHGDIENIVPFYERYGRDAVGRLEGMFGLAIWDDRRQALILARDRAGEKPLFWTTVDGELRFASEIQALLVYPDQLRRLNTEAAHLYQALGYVPAPHTMFEQIRKLPPAHLLAADPTRIDVSAYWEPAVAASAPSRLASPAQLRETLLRAVERELMSDVPVGVFTSGGLDSSLLAAAAARVKAGEQIHTYSVKFVERGYDESVFAEAVTHHIRTMHHVVTADDESLGHALEVVTRTLAEPVGDPAILPTYLLADAALPALERHLTWFGALGPDTGTVRALACLLVGFPTHDPLNRLLWLDFLTYLPDNLLVKVDRGTMLASIEARAPFLDREVMELVLPAPSALKGRGFTTQAILKEAARGLVPDG